MSTFV